MKILMVCLGNICRSPLAEGILRQKLEQNNIQHVLVDSAGTSDYHIGESPDGRSQENALSHDVDISMLRGRQFTVDDYDRFDQIFVMDSSNYSDVLSLARNENDKNKVDLILNKAFPNENRSVPDPYFGGEQGFENVYQLLDKACDQIISEINE